MDSPQQQFLDAVEQIPAFPESVQRVLTLAADISCSPRDLIDVIKHDPIFTLKILRVVNSPFIGLAREIRSIEQAGVYLGLNTIKNMALNLAAVGALPKKNKADFDMAGFWLHSLAVGVTARKLAALRRAEPPFEEYFSAGLLHDVGKVVLALHAPDQFTRALALAREQRMHLYQAEQEVLGATHAEIGRMLAERWGLPRTLVSGIALHHGEQETESSGMAACIQTADVVCKTLRLGFAGDPLTRPVDWNEDGPVNVKELVEAMPDLNEELDKARVFLQG